MRFDHNLTHLISTAYFSCLMEMEISLILITKKQVQLLCNVSFVLKLKNLKDFGGEIYQFNGSATVNLNIYN